MIIDSCGEGYRRSSSHVGMPGQICYKIRWPRPLNMNLVASAVTLKQFILQLELSNAGIAGSTLFTIRLRTRLRRWRSVIFPASVIPPHLPSNMTCPIYPSGFCASSVPRSSHRTGITQRRDLECLEQPEIRLFANEGPP